MKKIILTTIYSLIAMMVLSATGCKTTKTDELTEGKNDIYKILGYASLAGSSHNSQPWKAEVFPNDSLLIFADTSRLLKVVDPKGIELYISVGAFIENLDIAANAFGYNTKITLYETGINSVLPAASIKLTKNGQVQNPEPLKELELRTTLRIPFDTLAII